MPMREMMDEAMKAPWPMGRIEWFELTFFWVTVVVFITVIVVSLLRRRPVRKTALLSRLSGWRNWPEIRLLMLALPLELLWEIAQFPLYDVWHQNDWGYILYGLAHCTMGDLLILLALYEAIALVNRNRTWYATNKILARGVLFTLLGAGYTIYSETMNVRVKGNWGYTELMPLIPVIDVGGMPFLQWLLIPPILLWLMRQTKTVQPTPG